MAGLHLIEHARGLSDERVSVSATVREKFSCRDCETISQAPAPFHVNSEGMGEPEPAPDDRVRKFGQHLPLNRQAERYALEGAASIALSTMADAVGAGLDDA